MPFPYGDIAGAYSVASWCAALRTGAAGSKDKSPCGAIHKRRPYRIKSIVEGGFDFGFGDGAFADYVPMVAVQADDGAREDAAGVACV